MKTKIFHRDIPLHLMILPGFILVLIYCYGPMIGNIMAFQKFRPSLGIFGSPWIGLKNFEFVLDLPGTFQVVWNTLFISLMKIVCGIVIPVIFSLLLNEIRIQPFKRSVQTIIYFPHFLSWIILSGILIDVLSPSTGIANKFVSLLGFEPVFFLGNATWFPYTMLITDIWKELGFLTIVYLAALTGIDPALYEASYMDGAGRWKQTLYVTLPGMMNIIVLMAMLSMVNILNAGLGNGVISGFEQIFNLYSPQVYNTGDIIDTFIYRLGIMDAQYSVATVVGLFKSVVSFIFTVVSFSLAYKYTDYRLF